MRGTSHQFPTRAWSMTQPKRSLVDLQTQNRWLIWTHLFPESLHLVEVSLRYLRDRAVKWRGRNDGGQASACVRSCAHGVCRALTTILAALTLTAALALLLRPKTWATTECTLQHHAQDDEYLSYDKTKKPDFMPFYAKFTLGIGTVAHSACGDGTAMPPYTLRWPPRVASVSSWPVAFENNVCVRIAEQQSMLRWVWHSVSAFRFWPSLQIIFQSRCKAHLLLQLHLRALE